MALRLSAYETLLIPPLLVEALRPLSREETPGGRRRGPEEGGAAGVSPRERGMSRDGAVEGITTSSPIGPPAGC